MPESAEAVVIGAGVVGLAVARALAEAGVNVLIVEKEKAIGTETSSRNSEVIHSGLYYPAKSLKAQLCVTGKDALYRYAAQRGIPHKRCGKLIVATKTDEIENLYALERSGRANGVLDLEVLDRPAALDRQSGIACLKALWSPSTGIIDSHQFMLSLQGDVELKGGTVALGARVRAVEPGSGEILISFEPDGYVLRTGMVVIAAGLNASTLSEGLQKSAGGAWPQTELVKGSYFSYAASHPFRTLVYPVPQTAGLGVHATLDLGGHLRFGPDTEDVDKIDYEVSPSARKKFFEAIRRYWPDAEECRLQPDYAGIRPKAVREGVRVNDFVVSSPAEHNIDGLVSLVGIESPGLTASLALGRYVASLLGREAPGKAD